MINDSPDTRWSRRTPLVILAAVLFSISATAAQRPETGTIIRTVRGTATNVRGVPLAGVQVGVRDTGGTAVASAVSDTNGSFTLELRDGRYLVSADLASFAPLRGKVLEVGAEAEQQVTLVMQVPSIEQQIVVTANRTEAPLAQIGSSVTVITGAQLRADGTLWVADALRRVPGVNVSQSGGNGQLASLFMRGGESDYTKVLIDGIPVNDPGGAFNFGTLSTAGIDRIEIVRGPQSALFGSDAIAGVVQIFTRRATSERRFPRAEAVVEGGSYSSSLYSAGVQNRHERWDYALSFSRSDTDGNVANGSFNNEVASANLGVQLGDNTELRAIFRSEAGRTGVPGPWAFERPEQDEYYRNREFAGGLSLVHSMSARWNQKLSYSVHDSRQLSADPGDSGSFVASYNGVAAPFESYDYPYRTLNQTRRQRIGYQSDLSIGRTHTLTTGAEYERESGVVGDPDAGALRAVRDNAGVFLQDQWSAASRFFGTAGVRLEHNASFGFYAAPRLSTALHLREPAPGAFFGLTKLKANFGLGIKEPTLVESYSNSPFFRGNPGLRPEKSVSFDAGIEQYFGSGKGVFEITYFENRFRNQIGFSITDYQTFEGSFFNIGRTEARGIETGARAPIGRSVEVGASYTFLHSKVLESTVDYDPAFAAGQALFRRPRNSGRIDVRWSPMRWTLSASTLLVGSRVDSDFSGLGLTRNSGYGTLDFAATYRLYNGLTAYAVVNNALNRAYMDVLGFPALRAHFRLGLRTEW
jgi:vitamin B12 transporter